MVKGEDGGQGGVRKERDKFQGEREREKKKRGCRKEEETFVGQEGRNFTEREKGVELTRKEGRNCTEREKGVELTRKDREELHGKKDWTG